MAHFQSTTELIRKLRTLLVRQRIVLFAAGLMTTLAALVAAWIIMAGLANLWVLDVWFKVSVLFVVGGGAIYLFWKYAVGKLFGGNVEQVALALEEKNRSLKGRLIAAVQFALTPQPEGYSAELIEAAKLQALNQADGVDFNRVISFRPLWHNGRHLLAATLAALLFVVVLPGFFGYALEVYSSPTQRVAPPIAYELTPYPESTEHVKYRDITIGGILIGDRLPEQAAIHHRLAGGSWQETEIDLKAMVPITTLVGDSLNFSLTFRQADRSFDFYVQAGERRSQVQRVDVVDRPRVTGINLAVFFPEYTGLAPMTIDENNGSFSAVVGSRVTLKIETNLAIEQAELVFGDSSRTPLAIEGRTAATSLRVDQSREYHFELLDHLGEKNPDPIEYYITAVPDEYPSVDVIRPGFDANLSDEMILPLLVRIYDDYGFSSLVMKYELISQGRPTGQNVAVLHFSDRIKTEGDVEFNWDMDPLAMFPGDYVTYFFEVADNDNVSGPKISRSRQYIARLPSLDELIAQTDRESTERIDEVEQIVKAGKDLTRRMKDAARKLESHDPASNTNDWQQQKELETIAQESEAMVEKIDQMAEQMEKSLEQMADNSLTSRQILEKLQEIQKLFEEVATPEMREAQRRMMEMMKQMDQAQLQQAMKDMELSQEELLQRLERTLSLLKQMQALAKMETMLRRVEELIEKQEKVNADTETAPEEALSDLSRAEKKNLEQLGNLKKEADELRELLKEAEMDQIPEAQQFADAVKKSDADKDMQQMSESLEKKDRSEAGEQGEQAVSKLTQMMDSMQQAQMAMTEDNDEKLKQAMRRAVEHARNLSEEQEEQIEATRAINPTSIVLRDKAADQQDLARACEGLQRTIAELGNSSPFVASELGAVVNSALQKMGMAATELEEKRGVHAIQNQVEAMSDLNRTTTRLMESIEQMQNCQSGKNCDKGMAQLESLCRKQNKLNQQAQGSCSKPGTGSKPGSSAGATEEAGGLKRLAAEQGAIRKSLEELEQEFGGSRQVLGRLSDIASEMREVEEAFETGQAGTETLERQLRIYSRMLEASRSLQRKDFNQQRRAATAEEQPVWVPRDLPQELLDDRFEVEDRLRRFLGDNYPPQYEEQIKAYFRALLNARSQLRPESSNPESVTP